jgi:pathogenesis-related protein 1
MPSRARMFAWLIGLVVMGSGAGDVEAQESQSVELKSVQLAALSGTEKDRFLAAHNAARKAVGVEPVAWSDELSKVALESLRQQQDQLIEEAKEGWTERKVVLPEHREDREYGENIAGWAGSGSRSGKLPDAERAVAWWLEEKTAFDKLNAEGSYKFGDEEGKTETGADGKERPTVVGHYTAMVWRATTHLGAAKLTFQMADDRGIVRTYVTIVCNYDPAGNIEGEKPF